MIAANMVHVRVWGDFACFTRPEMKVERVSYPVMTPSAARGVLEAIFWKPQMMYLIDSIRVVRKGAWFSCRRNEVSEVVSIEAVLKAMAGAAPPPVIRAGAGGDDSAVQPRSMLALANVEYLISAEIRLTAAAQPPSDTLAKYVEEFRERADKGKCFQRPALGCREFAADFEGVSDPSGADLPEWTEDLGLMLYDVFDPRARESQREVGAAACLFRAHIRNGALDCHPSRVPILRPSPRSEA